MDRGKIFFLMLAIFTWMGCADAMLHLTYTVENKSGHAVKVFVPNYPVSRAPNLFGLFKDTTLLLKPDDKVIVGFDTKIDFPWATKNIYKNKPGICGLQETEADTIILLGCSTSEWKYKRRTSTLKIK